MITRRMLLLSSVLIALGVNARHFRKDSKEVSSCAKCPFPIDMITEFLGPEILRISDEGFRANATSLAMREGADLNALWHDHEWQALIRSDFEKDRILLVCGFVLSFTESMVYASESLRRAAVDNS